MKLTKLILHAVVEKTSSLDLGGWLSSTHGFEDAGGAGGHLHAATRIGLRDGFEVSWKQGYDVAYTSMYEKGYFRVTGQGGTFEIVGWDILLNWPMIKKYMLRERVFIQDCWITLVDEKSGQHWRFTTWAEALRGPREI